MVDLLITYISCFLSLGYTIIIGRFPKNFDVNICEILFKKKKYWIDIIVESELLICDFLWLKNNYTKCKWFFICCINEGNEF